MLLRQYLEVRLSVQSIADVPAAVAKTDQLQRQLWEHAAAVGQQLRDPVTALFIQSLNELIDLHAKRLTVALAHRVPGSILLTLGVASILSMGMLGYHFGLTGSRNTVPTLVLVLIFAAALLLIIDLDRPEQGLFTVGKQALLDLHNSIGGPR